MADVTTLTVRGGGGAVFQMDVPPEGSVRRDVFDQFVANGKLEILEGEIPEAQDKPEDEPTEGLAGMTVDGATKKADIVAAIEAAIAEDDDE